MRSFDVELSLPKPMVNRPRVDETYGMLQLAVRLFALLADLAAIGVFIWVGVVWQYVNYFAIAAACWAVIPGVAEIIGLCNTSRRIRRIPAALVIIIQATTLVLLGGSFFWFLFGRNQDQRQLEDPLLDEDEKEARYATLYVSFVMFAFHVLNLTFGWVDLCRRGH